MELAALRWHVQHSRGFSLAFVVVNHRSVRDAVVAELVTEGAAALDLHRGAGGPVPQIQAALATAATATSALAERRLLHAELVAVRVRHHHPAVAELIVAAPLNGRRARGEQDVDVRRHRLPAFGRILDAPADADVQVHPILGGHAPGTCWKKVRGLDASNITRAVLAD